MNLKTSVCKISSKLNKCHDETGHLQRLQNYILTKQKHLLEKWIYNLIDHDSYSIVALIRNNKLKINIVPKLYPHKIKFKQSKRRSKRERERERYPAEPSERHGNEESIIIIILWKKKKKGGS